MKKKLSIIALLALVTAIAQADDFPNIRFNELSNEYQKPFSSLDRSNKFGVYNSNNRERDEYAYQRRDYPEQARRSYRYDDDDSFETKRERRYYNDYQQERAESNYRRNGQQKYRFQQHYH